MLNNYEPNLLEINYLLLNKYYELFLSGIISEELFLKKKKELLEDFAWYEEYKSVEGKQAEEYALAAYSAFKKLNDALTVQEFERYSRSLQLLIKGQI